MTRKRLIPTGDHTCEVSEPRCSADRPSLIGVTLTTVLGTASSVLAQSLKDVQTPDTPLVLKAQGSFFVGGEKVEQTQGELGDLGPGGHITVNQMYVRYMVPQGGDGNVPVVMVHGATLTGKSWETTPDGRMGWDEYFVRKGHPVYVPDQVGRGRSGFNQAVFNNVRAGSAPASSLPRWIRFSDEVVWPNFRFGSKPGAPYADSQFPRDRRGRTVEAGCARRQLWRHPHTEPHAQGVVGSRQPGEWRGADGTLAIGIVSPGSGAAESCGGQRARARRTGWLSGELHRRADQDAGALPILVGLRRSPRHADRHRRSGPRGSSRSRAVRRSSVASRRLAARRRCSPRRTAASAATAT